MLVLNGETVHAYLRLFVFGVALYFRESAGATPAAAVGGSPLADT
jgi:hypothetical protein